MELDRPVNEVGQSEVVVFGIAGRDAVKLKLVPRVTGAGLAEPFVDIGIYHEGIVLDEAGALQLAAVLLRWSLDRST